MNRIGPSVAAGHPEIVSERSRFEWRLGDPGDPAALLEEFLAGHGLPVRPLSGPAGDPGAHAELLVSAAAGAAMLGAPTGAPSPCPAVPDVVAVVRHTGRPGRGTAPPGRPEPCRPEPGCPARSHPDPDLAEPGRPAGWRVGRWQESWSPARHAAAVRAVRSAVGRGDVYQVNLVGHASARYAGDPLPALRRLAGLPGARYGAVLAGDGWAVGCASPEMLLRVRDGQVSTGPIKGTRPATRRGRIALLRSEKERAEHVMIVDMARNDLARVAATGSVRVPELYTVRRWCHLWQAESVVTAALAPGVGLAALLRAVCPPASVTGAPKLSALERIAALEPVGRGPAMGALGRVGPHGLDLGLTIRTAAADGHRLHVWAGGGVTWGSRPADEVAEAAAKAAPLRTALVSGTPRSAAAAPGRTRRWSSTPTRRWPRRPAAAP